MYIPDCNSPEVKALIRDGYLPSNLCTYPPEVIAQICSRQPSLCVPTNETVPPSIWEPIIGTAQDVGNRILTTTQAAGTGVLGTIDLATVALKMAPFILIGVGLLYLSKR